MASELQTGGTWSYLIIFRLLLDLVSAFSDSWDKEYLGRELQIVTIGSGDFEAMIGRVYRHGTSFMCTE